jgi:predicted SnoaL-like aldol condensation-catalyzing enzyme
MKASPIVRLVPFCVLLLSGSIALSAQSSTMTAQEQANLKFVLDWWREVIAARHVELAPKYQAEDYIQHNINVQTGRAGFVKFFSAFGPPINPIPPTMANPPAVQFAKGDYVALIWEREAKDPADPTKTYKYNTYDLLRMQNGRVQEHWDYAIKTKGIPRGGAPDGVDYDKVTFKLSPQEQKNLEVAIVEFKDILQYGHVELAEKVMAASYIQHNPNVPTGRAAFVEFFSKIRKPEPIKPEWKNKPTLTIVSGPYVFFMFKREEKDPDDPARTYPAYWFDMVRVENGLIQEHWDSAMKNPPPGPGRGGN